MYHLLFLAVFLLSILIAVFVWTKSPVSSADYNITVIHNFLTNEECDEIINLAQQKTLFPSKVYSEESDLLENNTRKSEQCWLDDSLPLLKTLSDKIKNMTNTHSHHHEQLQVVRYSPGGFFSPHYDACDGDTSFCNRMNGSLAPRYLTLLIYLNDNFSGGQTVFPHLGQSVTPKKGTAILFQNVDKNGTIIKQSFHGGDPVSSGEKWIANKWIRLH